MIKVKFQVDVDVGGLRNPVTGAPINGYDSVEWEVDWPWPALPRRDDRVEFHEHGGIRVVVSTVSWTPCDRGDPANRIVVIRGMGCKP